MGSLVAVDTDPFAAAAPPSGNLVPVDHDPFAAPTEASTPPVDKSFSAGLQHGLTGTGIGLIQTANDLTGQRLLSPEWKAAADRAAAKVGQQEKGTGIIGTAGEIAGNPLNWAPWKSLLAYGATQGLTAPQSNDTGIGGRATQAAIGAPVAAITGTAAKYLVGKPLQYLANKSGLTDLVANGLQKFGITGDSGDLYKLAQQANLDTKGKSPQEIADSLQNWYQEQSKDLASKVSQQPFNPQEGFKGIAGNWSAEQQAANEAYKTAQTTGGGITQQIPQLPAKLDSVISAMEGNTLPGTSEHTALQQLKNIRATLPDNVGSSYGFGGETIPAESAAVPASTLMDLRANLNEGFNPKLLPERGDIAPNSILSDVRGALAKAGEQNPQFGEQLQYADARQGNLGYSYKNNALLQKYFKPEDLTALQQNANSGTPIPDITLKRANALIAGIKTPEDMATLSKAMPTDMANSLQAAKIEQMMNKAGFDYKKLTNPDFMALMQKSLANSPEGLKQLSTIQQVADVLNRRSINVMSPQPSQESSHDAMMGFRAVWDLFEGRKAYAIRAAYRSLTDQESNALKGLQGEINSGAPFRSSIPGLVSKGAAAATINGLRTPNAPMPDATPSQQTVQSPIPPQSNAQPLFNRVLATESGGKQFNPKGNPLISNKGAVGVAQLMPTTAYDAAKAAGLPYDPRRIYTDANYNAALGKAYLGQMQKKYGDDRLALMAYNWGPGNVDKWLKSGSNPDKIPTETQNYVRRILG